MPACEPVNDRAWNRQERHGDALPGGQQHVEFAGFGHGRDLGCEVEQLVGGVTHGGDDDDHVVAALSRRDHSLGDALDALGILHR
jgi:hypothetical protein